MTRKFLQFNGFPAKWLPTNKHNGNRVIHHDPFVEGGCCFSGVVQQHWLWNNNDCQFSAENAGVVLVRTQMRYTPVLQIDERVHRLSLSKTLLSFFNAITILMKIKN